jgi:hypothetical protein
MVKICFRHCVAYVMIGKFELESLNLTVVYCKKNKNKNHGKDLIITNLKLTLGIPRLQHVRSLTPLTTAAVSRTNRRLNYTGIYVVSVAHST